MAFTFDFPEGLCRVAAIIFVVEVLIALFIKDRFIRPYFGDVLVVILMYSFVHAFFRFPWKWVACGVLLFSFLIEFLQYVNFVEILGLHRSAFARTVMGTSFAWNDILAYIAGILIVVLTEYWRKRTH